MSDSEQIDLSGDGGVLKRILAEGTGEEKPFDGCRVSLHYTGTLTDGKKFDSSVDRGEPFEFELGKGSVIKAFDMGVASMRRGEKCVLTCAPQYAYGEAGSPPNIPPNATLLFELELLAWKGEDLSPRRNEGIMRTVLERSGKRGSPKEGALVKVGLKGSFEGRVFDEREVSFNVGEGSEAGVIQGVDVAIEKFKEGERSLLTIAAEYAFGAEGNAEFNIPPGASVQYEVRLLEFEKVKQPWEMDPEEKIVQARLLKEQGTNYLKEDKPALALKKFEKCKSYLSGFPDSNEEWRPIQLAVHLNKSLAFQKLGRHEDVVAACNAALEMDPRAVKAYYRRGQARIVRQAYEEAIKDFNRVLEIEPTNKAAAAQIAACHGKIAEYKQREKRLYGNMFAKFAATDQLREDEARSREPDVMNSKFGEWNDEEREREPTKFEQENPDVLMLNGSSKEFQNM